MMAWFSGLSRHAFRTATMDHSRMSVRFDLDFNLTWIVVIDVAMVKQQWNSLQLSQLNRQRQHQPCLIPTLGAHEAHVANDSDDVAFEPKAELSLLWQWRTSPDLWMLLPEFLLLFPSTRQQALKLSKKRGSMRWYLSGRPTPSLEGERRSVLRALVSLCDW